MEKSSSSPKPIKHWSAIEENTVVWGIRLLYVLYRVGGRFLFFISLWPVIVFYWLAMPQVRRASSDYLSHAYQAGVLSFAPSVFTSLHHVFHFADTILDKILAVAGKFTKKDLFVQGRDELIADPRGAVLVTAHTGCLELCQVLASERSSHKLVILTHTRHSQRFNRILKRLNPTFEVNHIEVTELTPAVAAQLAEQVNQGNYVVIVGDRTPIGSNAVSPASFLGETALFPNGFALLATILHCPLWAMVCTRNYDREISSRYRVEFTKLWEPVAVKRKDRPQHFDSLCQAFADCLARNLKHSPLDWFNFFDFWREKSKISLEKQNLEKGQ